MIDECYVPDWTTGASKLLLATGSPCYTMLRMIYSVHSHAGGRDQLPFHDKSALNKQTQNTVALEL